MASYPIKIENVVASASLGVEVPVDKMLSGSDKPEYGTEVPGLVYKINEPNAAALVFSSGRVVCTGAKSIESAKDVLKKVAEKVRKTGVDVPKDFSIEIEGIVASSRIDTKISFEEIAFSLEDAQYDPQQFPGIIYRMKEPRVSALIMKSGRVIFSGARTIDEVQRALLKLNGKLNDMKTKKKVS